jgi:hypothetical protein
MDIFDEMEKTDIASSPKPSSRVSELKFTPGTLQKDGTTLEDGDLLTIVKNLVNEADLTYNDLYTKFGRQLGWNMINSARNGQISWERFKKWMEILDMDIDLTIKPKDK